MSSLCSQYLVPVEVWQPSSQHLANFMLHFRYLSPIMDSTAAMTNKTVLDRYLALPQGERYKGGNCFCSDFSDLGFKLCTFGLMELEKV